MVICRTNAGILREAVAAAKRSQRLHIVGGIDDRPTNKPEDLQGANNFVRAALTDMEVGARATVVRTQGELGVIGEEATVGPFTYIRPGTELGARGKLGGFVEAKNAELGRGTKVPHLTYIGDATVGEESNIGASSVFVNYDGVDKHHTTIGSHVRTGSDTMFIAPVVVGDGAYSGAGTVIKEDVPPGALVVSGGKQRNVEGWVAKKRPGTPAAEAGEAAAKRVAEGGSPASTPQADQQ